MIVQNSSDAHHLYCHTSHSYLIALWVTGWFAVIMNVFVHCSTKLGVLPDLPWWRLVFPFHGCDGNLAKQFGRG